MAPLGGPLIEGARICKQHASTRIALGAGCRIAKEAKDKGEISAIVGHAVQKVLCQRHIVGLCFQQAKLAAEARGVRRIK
jgi:hypothetical protein